MAFIAYMGTAETDAVGTYMIDFIVNTLAEIADFFISFGVDKIIDKFTKK